MQFSSFILAALQLHAITAFEMQSFLSILSLLNSRLPTFILDLNHPWIAANPGIDVDALCSLNSTLRTDAQAQRYPPSLFKYLEIDNNKAGVNRAGWSNARSRLLEMLACPAALQDVEHLKVGVWVSKGEYGIGIPESSSPPRQVKELFVQALSSMSNLRKLEWNTFGDGDESFKQAFATANLTLPSVRHLSTARSAYFLVNACTDIVELDSGDPTGHSYLRSSSALDLREQLIDSTRNLTSLTTFGMQGEWEIENLEALLKYRPGLQTMRIDGEIASRWSSLYQPVGSILREFLEVLTQFTRLEVLRLPPSFALGLGFDGGPDCGNAYFGPGGRSYRRYVTAQDAETTEQAGQTVLSMLPNLTSLEIGGYCAAISRSEDGSSITWPWTSGGIHNWTFTMWPDRESYPGEDDEN